MKKLKAKQIVTIVIAALIGAGICAFPFIWNALHKPEKVAETVELPKTSVKSTVNPDTPENLLSNGYFKDGLNWGYGPFYPAASYGISIASNWYIAQSISTTNFSISFTENSEEVYNTIKITLNSYVTGLKPYIFSTLDLSDFQEGKQYTVSAYVVNTQNIHNVYRQYTFTMPELNQSKTFGAGPITGTSDTDITAELEYTTGTNPNLTFKVGYIDPTSGASYYSNMRIGAIKIEEGTRSTLQNDIEGTTPEPPNDYDTGYEDGYQDGYEQGMQQGIQDTKDELSAQLIGGPSIAWETVNPNVEASYDAATDTLTAGNMTTSIDLIRFDLQQQLAIGMTIIVEWDSMTTTGTLNVSFNYNYLTGTGKYITITGSNNTGQASFLIPQAALIENQTVSTIFFKNQSGADVTIKGLKIKLLNDATKNYQQGYQAGLEQGQANAGENYNNGYQAGLAAGRAEGSESSNFSELFTGIFGSLLAFFLTVGNGVTIWDISLFNIVISFVAIFLIVKVVKNII